MYTAEIAVWEAQNCSVLAVQYDAAERADARVVGEMDGGLAIAVDDSGTRYFKRKRRLSFLKA